MYFSIYKTLYILHLLSNLYRKVYTQGVQLEK